LGSCLPACVLAVPAACTCLPAPCYAASLLLLTRYLPLPSMARLYLPALRFPHFPGVTYSARAPAFPFPSLHRVLPFAPPPRTPTTHCLPRRHHTPPTAQHLPRHHCSRFPCTLTPTACYRLPLQRLHLFSSHHLYLTATYRSTLLFARGADGRGVEHLSLWRGL